MSDLKHIDTAYKNWIAALSARFKQSQIKAAVRVNNELLSFYWQLGKDIVELDAESRWGKGVMKSISDDLKSELPGVSGLSPTNLYYMKWFYQTYSQGTAFLPQLGVKSHDRILPQLGGESKNPQDVLILFSIPWTHHKYILDKYKNNPEKAFFFVRQAYENNWSRNVLLNFLDTDLYERQGKALTNFKNTLPEPDGELAQQLTKDPYSFDFLSMTQGYMEKELKDALVKNIEKFLLELGKGFAYMGREYRIMVGEDEKFIDMLFYNVSLHCYVVVEIKTGKFDSDNIGQLGTYVVAVNKQLNSPKDGPAIGLLICKEKNDVLARYALESTSQPLGISRYELSKVYPESFKGSIPTIEEIENELNNRVP